MQGGLPVNERKKLIEVALPLEAINREAAKEKSIRHGHPSTLHLWWARRPLAACRAVLFASIIDDPSSYPEVFPTEEAQKKERKRLFKLIERLVAWENSNNEQVLAEVHEEIKKATGGDPPPVLDPFCGGGSIPLEAQRLGLRAFASDINPVAILITKALVEIPTKFAGQAPVNCEARNKPINSVWPGTTGLAEDVRYYGRLVRDKAVQAIGKYYPKISLSEAAGGESDVVAWLWARTIVCPNPACGLQIPLLKSYSVSTKKGTQSWVEPIIDEGSNEVRFTVCSGKAVPENARHGTILRNGAVCPRCLSSISLNYIREQGKAGRLGKKLLAIVADGPRGRVYLSPTEEQEVIASTSLPQHWIPETELEGKSAVNVSLYGLETHGSLFTQRQLLSLSTFSDLIRQVRDKIMSDAKAIEKALADGSREGFESKDVEAYADAVVTYLAFALSKMADRGSTICTWYTDRDSTRHTFTRHAIPMTWDFAELNPFLSGTGSFVGACDWTAESLEGLQHLASLPGCVTQQDATEVESPGRRPLVSTDPPYYDNIDYASLSDYFYIWLRRSVGHLYPELFTTMLVPKIRELVATPYKFGGDKGKAKAFFESGLFSAFQRCAQLCDPAYPVTVYYAFRQEESDEAGANSRESVSSTGWETMLSALIMAGFRVVGTWPMRSELSNRTVASGANALASSIVLVCRLSSPEAEVVTRRDFIRQLRQELPSSLSNLMSGGIAPVDLAQAAIGPGMAVFSKYSAVIDPDGERMTVKTALQIINFELDKFLTSSLGDTDSDTRFCVAWFEQYGWDEGPFGEADVLARAKNTAIQGLVDAGVLIAKAGKAALMPRLSYPSSWDPSKDSRLTTWECTQHLVRALLDKSGGGEDASALMVLRMGRGRAEEARELAYHLYSICQQKGWSEEAQGYNALVVSWPDIKKRATAMSLSGVTAGGLF